MLGAEVTSKSWWTELFDIELSEQRPDAIFEATGPTRNAIRRGLLKRGNEVFCAGAVDLGFLEVFEDAALSAYCRGDTCLSVLLHLGHADVCLNKS